MEKLCFLLVKENLFYRAGIITDDHFILNSDIIVLHAVKNIQKQLVMILNILQN